MLQKSGPFCHELNYFYICAVQSQRMDLMKLWSALTVIHCLHLSLEKSNLHSGCAESQQICCVCTRPSFPLIKGQSREVRGRDTSLHRGLYWHINGVIVCGELVWPKVEWVSWSPPPSGPKTPKDSWHTTASITEAGRREDITPQSGCMGENGLACEGIMPAVCKEYMCSNPLLFPLTYVKLYFLILNRSFYTLQPFLLTSL